MQSAKGSQNFRFEHYQISLTVFSEKKLQITVVDSLEKMEFHQKLLTLQKIGTTTLLKALEGKTIQIKMGVKVKKTAQTAVMEIDVLVASQFLRPVQELIFLKKSKDISQSELLQNAVSSLSAKIKKVKEEDRSPNTVRCGTVQLDEKSYNSGVNYQTIAAIKLPKGKYILTLSFLVKASGTWMYIYFQQGQQVIQNCGFYLPTGTQFIPMIVRKSYSVTANEQNVTFTTYYGQSYPHILKNVVLTAQSIE